MIELLESRLLLSSAWYVAASGNDSAAGTLGQPFRSIQRAANLALPGDTVYIRGGAYHETVTPAHSGTASAPITFEPYGNETVTIDGADPISNWSRYSGSIYSTAQPWTLGEGNDQVFVDGTMINEARWPNSGLDISHFPTAVASAISTSAPGTDYLLPSTATLYDSALPGGTNFWQGATIHIGLGNDWVVQSGAVLSSSTGSLTFSFLHLTSYEDPQAGNHFYLTGSFKALDSAGEWYRDPNTGRLYIWTPASDSPASHTIEAKARQFGFELSARSYINIRGIRFFATSIDTDSQTSHVQISSINATYVTQLMNDPNPWDGENFGADTGIRINGSYNVLSNSSIAYSSGDGVWMSGAHNIVQYCSIHDVDYAGGDQSGIQVTGASQQILSNGIYYGGRDGILASDASASQINGNTVHDVGIQTTDLGGIYTYGTVAHGTEIAYNTIYNVHTGGYGAAGVYLDNGSAGYIVHNNNISSVDTRLKLNPPSYSNSIYSDPISYGSQVAAPSTAPRKYTYGLVTLESVGTLGGFNSEALGINNYAGVVGSDISGSGRPAFYYATGSIHSFGTLGGNYSISNSINDSYQVVGASNTFGGPQQAFFFSGGAMYRMGTLPGDYGSAGTSINRFGQAVGVSYNGYAESHAFYYGGGRMVNLGTLGGAQSEAYGINDAGAIVGASTLSDNRNAHAFYYANNRMYDLGTLGGSSSYAMAINNHNQIVGESMVSGDGAFHAFIYDFGTMRDLGTLAGYRNSVATGINDNGDIVGYAWNSDTSAPRPFIYHNGTMYDLNRFIPSNSGWTLQNAYGINTRGQVVGGGIDPTGQHRGYVLSLSF